jgi:hypothetical protein
MRVRATTASRGSGARRETAARAHLLSRPKPLPHDSQPFSIAELSTPSLPLTRLLCLTATAPLTTAAGGGRSNHAAARRGRFFVGTRRC